MVDPAKGQGFVRRHAWALGILGALVLLVLVFDWNWLRAPIERAVSNRIHREFHLGAIEVHLGREPMVRLKDISVGNLPGAREPTMARIGAVEARLSLGDLLKGQVNLTRVAVSDADVLLEHDRDGRKNWLLMDDPPDPKQAARTVKIGGVSINSGRLRLRDEVVPMEADVNVASIDASADAGARRTESTPDNGRYATRIDVRGHYRGNTFSGLALTGNVLSLQQSGIAFPIRAELTAGPTRLQMEGTIADALSPSMMDVRLQIAGETLANLYPFLLLPLPASPPYDIRGRLQLKEGRYAIEDLAGRIGSTDVRGSGAYVVREPRPLLTVNLECDLLKFADLGPLVGVQTESRPGKLQAGQAAVATRERARATEKATRGDRLLPAGTFDPERLRLIDADATLVAHRVDAPGPIPIEGLKAALQLRDAVLRVEPLEIGVAGGKAVTKATLDARTGPALATELSTQVRGIRLERLVPKSKRLAASAGRVNADLELRGQGNSIAQAAAAADGRIAAGVSAGEISNLLDAASGLNFGKVIPLLLGGDRSVRINCGGVHFNVKDGQGASSLFVVDTSQTQIVGAGRFDLDHERFELEVAPKPKEPSLLSLRTPVRVHGSFSDPQIAVEKTPLLLRIGGALALGAVAPLAALIPLIETGPGEDTNCRQVLAAAGAKK